MKHWFVNKFNFGNHQAWNAYTCATETHARLSFGFCGTFSKGERVVCLSHHKPRCGLVQLQGVGH